eukprot:8879774-Pyramimonas_sp.AAC.1
MHHGRVRGGASPGPPHSLSCTHPEEPHTFSDKGTSATCPSGILRWRVASARVKRYTPPTWMVKRFACACHSMRLNFWPPRIKMVTGRLHCCAFT